jgi:hypothetical protein
MMLGMEFQRMSTIPLDNSCLVMQSMVVADLERLDMVQPGKEPNWPELLCKSSPQGTFYRLEIPFLQGSSYLVLLCKAMRLPDRQYKSSQQDKLSP